MERVEQTCQNGNILFVEDTLSDGSKTYKIRLIGEDYSHFVNISCVNIQVAEELFTLLCDKERYLL